LHNKLKDVDAKLDVPPLTGELRRFIDWVADYTLGARGSVLGMALRMGAQGPARVLHEFLEVPRRQGRAHRQDHLRVHQRGDRIQVLQRVDPDHLAPRVAQEALQNVRKHAGASTVMVSTDVTGDEWTLEIRDDGRGFDMGTVAKRGPRNFGMQVMNERAELIGARFDVRSRPDGGTVVRLAIPTGDLTGAKENG
jgi:K+-sensing histidine kinase KdpD